ncbi:MAG: Jag N-terminal domain-containing protein [Oscillospiraceae bacterium]|nr:Jag N-terminal domain-containing protein [Oscillospiraceae bacterium]
MIKSIEATGKTETIAIENALKQLGMERDDVSVEVIARAKSGFLGIGSQPARIRVSYEVPDEPALAPVRETPKPVQEKKPEPVQPAAPVEEKKEQAPAAPRQKPARTEKKQPKASQPPRKPRTEEPKAEKAAPAQSPELPAAPVVAAAPVDPATLEEGSVEDKIYRFLTGLLAHMGNEAQISITAAENATYQVELIGQGIGSLIGRRGETLDAIQQLTNYSVNRGQNHRVRIHIDAENYRAKREESLQRLARKTAAKVVKNRRNITLEPMNAYERHVIHSALQEYRNVTTYSVGTEPNRRIVISYSRGERYNNYSNQE